MNIHPSSIIEPGAQVHPEAVIGPFCHVGPRVVIGAGTRLLSHVAVRGRTTIGQGNVIWPNAVVGGDPQDLKFRGEDSLLEIGDHNDIRECVTLHLGTANGGNVTRVGSHNLIMAYVHAGHDCIIGDHCIIANAVQLAGHINIQDYANIGGATAIHHYVTIGRYAFVGGMTRVVRDVPPFMTVEGNPSRVRGVNTIGLERRGFSVESQQRLKEAWRRLFKSAHEDSGVGDTDDALNKLEADFPDDECIRTLVQAMRRSLTGTYGRHREAARKDDRYHNPVK